MASDYSYSDPPTPPYHSSDSQWPWSTSSARPSPTPPTTPPSSSPPSSSPPRSPRRSQSAARKHLAPKHTAPKHTKPKHPKTKHADPHVDRRSGFIGMRLDTGAYIVDLHSTPSTPFRLCNCPACITARGDTVPDVRLFFSASEFDDWCADRTGLPRKFVAQDALGDEEDTLAVAADVVDRHSQDERFPHHFDSLDDADDADDDHCRSEPSWLHVLAIRLVVYTVMVCQLLWLWWSGILLAPTPRFTYDQVWQCMPHRVVARWWISYVVSASCWVYQESARCRLLYATYLVFEYIKASPASAALLIACVLMVGGLVIWSAVHRHETEQ
ncbi:uncharacterized protein LOC62_01G001537 [Vanrija pseudolonga]|uniref:Uncharacterized protein n=1 Tax=Vanrija pseudolonga TaxID=143232 RepID=A0AAF1BHT1_9TREE|nr:hypothetical protein LOC62_01G001537 [Vanrija pseudolonga]